MNTAPWTRSGWSAASRVPQSAPQERPTTTAVSVPVASMTASESSANSRSVYARDPAGPVGLPVPAPVEREDAEVAREVGDLHLPVRASG